MANVVEGLSTWVLQPRVYSSKSIGCMYFQIIPTVKVQNVGSRLVADSGPQCSVPSATPSVEVNNAIYMKF